MTDAPEDKRTPVRITITLDDGRGADPQQLSQALYVAAMDLLDARTTPTWPITIMVGSVARRPLAPRQKVIYEAIVKFFREHGHVPTQRELGTLTGVKSTNGITCHLGTGPF